MDGGRRAVSPSFILSRSVALLVVLIPLIASIGWPTLTQRTDYVSHFYVAGRMVAEGRASELYPDPSAAASLATAPVNVFAHQLLPHLPATDTIVYLYGPLVAWVFVPFSLLSPGLSMVAWQLTSIAALVAGTLLLASVTGQRGSDALWATLLYFPVFHTLLIGHLGLTFGVLPLAVGYVCLVREKPFWAGLVWSLLLLKPHFIPTVLLMVGVLVLRGHLRCLLGCISGGVLLAGLTASLAPGLGSQWLSAMKFDDAVFSDGRYGYPAHLMTSLPAVGLHLLPGHLRHVVKLLGYGLGVLVGVHALWRSYQLAGTKTADARSDLPLIFLLGIGVLPVVAPHLLYYDLSVLTLAALVMAGTFWSEREKRRLRWIALTYLLATNAYLLLFMFVSPRLAEPLPLVAVLVFLYTRLLGVARERRLAQPA